MTDKNNKSSKPNLSTAPDYEFDNLDRAILAALMDDSRRAYTDIAEQLTVSSGTIHVRVDKMKAAGVIKGSRLNVDPKKLGYGVMAFIGVILEQPTYLHHFCDEIEKLPAILEAHYTTGKHSLVIKVATRSIESLHSFLVRELQTIEGVKNTETMILLDSPIERSLVP